MLDHVKLCIQGALLTLVCCSTRAAATGVVELWHSDGLLVAFPIIAYSFTAHPYYLGIFNNMQTASTKRMVKVTDMVRRELEGCDVMSCTVRFLVRRWVAANSTDACGVLLAGDLAGWGRCLGSSRFPLAACLVV